MPDTSTSYVPFCVTLAAAVVAPFPRRRTSSVTVVLAS
jgi:hypothetical protein